MQAALLTHREKERQRRMIELLSKEFSRKCHEHSAAGARAQVRIV